jgi:dephospho-CoA kinase
MHRLIGITGKLASGKTEALNYLATKGYKIFSADDEVRKLYLKEGVILKVTSILGLSAPPNSLIVKEIGDIIYHDEVKKNALEELVHPMVEEKLANFVTNLHDGELGFAEVPLLFETNMDRFFDYTILIYCDRDVRMQRAIERGFKAERFDKIDAIQMSDELKKLRADFLIDSNVEIDEFKGRIDRIVGGMIK